MNRETDIDRRSRLRSALVKAGREEHASSSLQATLLAIAREARGATASDATASSGDTLAPPCSPDDRDVTDVEPPGTI